MNYSAWLTCFHPRFSWLFAYSFPTPKMNQSPLEVNHPNVVTSLRYILYYDFNFEYKYFIIQQRMKNNGNRNFYFVQNRYFREFFFHLFLTTKKMLMMMMMLRPACRPILYFLFLSLSFVLKIYESQPCEISGILHHQLHIYTHYMFFFIYLCSFFYDK